LILKGLRASVGFISFHLLCSALIGPVSLALTE
jgi:hypothetical protein